MSWFIGINGKTASSLLTQYYPSLNIVQDNILKTNESILIFGGIKENLKYNFDKDGNGWLVSGLVIQKRDEKFSFMKKDDLENFLTLDEFNIKELDGHFCGLIFKDKKIILFNDQLGLREIYYKKTDNAFLFSSRIDLAAKFNRENEINVNAFSSTWLLTHQISFDCVTKEFKRLGPGGKLIIENSSAKKSNSSWSFDFDQTSTPENFEKKLTLLSTLQARENLHLNLGLSGGLDSRFLLDILLKSEINFSTHTFGDENIPDGRIAKIIIQNLNIGHEFLIEALPKPDKLLERFYNYVPLLGLSTSIFETMHFPFYDKLYSEGYFIIDGAFGETFRRGFLNKILIKNKNAVYRKDAKKIIEFLRNKKADIFDDEFESILTESAVNQISDYLNLSPDPNDIGIENWLDYFISKTKITNLCGSGQSVMDNLCLSFMPFIQPSILNSGLSLPISERRNGALFKKTIRKDGFKLDKYPLVKNQVVYPYSLNNFYSRLYTMFKKKLGYVYKDNSKIIILNKLKEFAFDKSNTIEVKNFQLYDHKKIKNLVNNFYSGNFYLADELIWWLTFEIWREKMRITK